MYKFYIKKCYVKSIVVIKETEKLFNCLPNIHFMIIGFPYQELREIFVEPKVQNYARKAYTCIHLALFTLPWGENQSFLGAGVREPWPWPYPRSKI